MQRILVIGGTGLIGGQVVAQLAAAGVPVRVMARRPEEARLPAQVEVMAGDLTIPETVDRCLEGIERVFLVWTAPAAAADAALERIARPGRRVVYLSAPLKTPHPFFQQPNPSRRLAERIERTIEDSGCDWTFLRPHMFAADARGFWGPAMRAGDTVRWPYLEAPTAPIDERDIAAAGVRALCEDGQGRAEYVLTGPESLTQREQVATIGRALGRELRIEEISPEQARSELGATFPAVVIEILLQAWAAALGQPAYVNGTFGELMGREPRSFAEWAADHAGEFRG